MKKETGFTLIELMLTLIVAGALMAVAVPAFQDMVNGNRLTTHVNDFISATNYSRSEAVKRGGRISMCPSLNGTSCTTGWQNGWAVFQDTDADGVLDAGETILRVHETLSGNSITFSGVKNGADTYDYISYNSQGMTKTSAGGVLSGKLLLCDSRGFAEAKGVNVTGGGHISVVLTASLTPDFTACP